MRRVLFLLVPLLVVACDRETVTSPEPPASSVALEGSPVALSAAGATVTQGTGTFSLDAIQFWDCIGEMIHNQFEVTYDYTLVVLPSGESVYRDLWPSTGPLGTVTGLSSGTVWVRERTLGPDVIRSTGGGLQMFTTNALFVSETGPTIHVREVFHLSGNANGEVTADFYQAYCDVR
jgi:hypothetical protein